MSLRGVEALACWGFSTCYKSMLLIPGDGKQDYLSGIKRAMANIQLNTEKKVRKRDKIQTEKKILATAEKLFAQYGFDAVSTKQLANKAGVAIGALYHHFPSKEAVYAAATRQAFAKKAVFPEQLVDSNEPPERQLVILVSWFIDSLLMDKTFGLLVKREMLDPRSSTSLLLDKNVFAKQLNLFRQLLAQVAPKSDADEAVAAMLALLFGFANLKGIYALFPSAGKALNSTEEIAEYAIGILLRGLPEK